MPRWMRNLLILMGIILLASYMFNINIQQALLGLLHAIQTVHNTNHH